MASGRLYGRWPRGRGPRDVAPRGVRRPPELSPTIHVPTLLVWGDRDVRAPIVIAHQIRDAIPDARLAVIRGAGHGQQPRTTGALQFGCAGVLPVDLLSLESRSTLGRQGRPRPTPCGTLPPERSRVGGPFGRSW
ncbi:MAG: hypothetical protein EXR69_16680 [Myxococcales bacterium]|nr:hypothetical protein [Myxococcales bacterium]